MSSANSNHLTENYVSTLCHPHARRSEQQRNEHEKKTDNHQQQLQHQLRTKYELFKLANKMH